MLDDRCMGPSQRRGNEHLRSGVFAEQMRRELQGLLLTCHFPKPGLPLPNLWWISKRGKCSGSHTREYLKRVANVNCQPFSVNRRSV